MKGGTCLKKCFFETYRFSENLDFSLLPDTPYTEADIRQLATEIAEWAADQSGIEIPADRIVVRPRHDKLGRATFQVKLSYRGPLRIPTWPVLSFDITAHEPVLATTVLRPVNHAYPDALPDGTAVPCYSLDELFAEKSRALFERTRPRDLYNVVCIAENSFDQLNPSRVRDLFRKKCLNKGRDPKCGLVTLLRSPSRRSTLRRDKCTPGPRGYLRERSCNRQPRRGWGSHRRWCSSWP
jgi:predicted nucleotidyltransferase component of viral defense system